MTQEMFATLGKTSRQHTVFLKSYFSKAYGEVFDDFFLPI